jgi:hypothetical protein
MKNASLVQTLIIYHDGVLFPTSPVTIGGEPSAYRLSARNTMYAMYTAIIKAP